MKIIILILLGLFYFNSNTIYSQNAPVTTAGAFVTNEAAITLTITAVNFNNIGSCNLKLVYDAAIVTATAITTGSQLGGSLASNLNIPGVITLGWYTYPGVTLPDNSVIFNIDFSKVSTGTSVLTWMDDGYSCIYYDGNFNPLNDLPTPTYYINGSVTFQSTDAPLTLVPDITVCPGTISVDIPVTVSAFYQIGALSLTLQYNSLALTYQSFTNDSGFPGLQVNGTSPGTIVAGGFSAASDGITLADNTVLFTLHFNIQGGFSELTWYDNGETCEYTGPAPLYTTLNDTPQGSYYFNGSFTELQIPAATGTITGPANGNVCQGETGVIFSVNPISNSTTYVWSLPAGAIITGGANTNIITVSFSSYAESGNVTVYGSNECGNGTVSPVFPVTVNIAPVITQQPASPDTVNAGAGIATFSITAAGSNLTYQWQEYITDWANVPDEGIYSGVFTSALTITNPPITMNGCKYRCIVTGTCEPPATSDGLATLTVVTITGFSFRDAQNDVANDVLKFNSWPNPMNNEATFKYYLPAEGNVQIKLFNSAGKNVFTSIKNSEKEGYHNLKFESNQLQPGFYTVKIMVRTKNNLMSSSIKIICKK